MAICKPLVLRLLLTALRNAAAAVPTAALAAPAAPLADSANPGRNTLPRKERPARAVRSVTHKETCGGSTSPVAVPGAGEPLSRNSGWFATWIDLRPIWLRAIVGPSWAFNCELARDALIAVPTVLVRV